MLSTYCEGRKNRMAVSFYVDNGDAGTAKLHMLVANVADVGNGAEILTYELAQNAVAFAMEDAHAAHTNEYGIVNEILHLVKCLVAAHAS